MPDPAELVSTIFGVFVLVFLAAALFSVFRGRDISTLVSAFGDWAPVFLVLLIGVYFLLYAKQAL